MNNPAKILLFIDQLSLTCSAGYWQALSILPAMGHSSDSANCRHVSRSICSVSGSSTKVAVSSAAEAAAAGVLGSGTWGAIQYFLKHSKKCKNHQQIAVKKVTKRKITTKLWTLVEDW